MADQCSVIVKQLEEDQIGFNESVKGPFGHRKIIYTDHTASGRALGFIEQYITSKVLPHYANTHSGTSHCSRQTTFFREEAREIIRNAVNASSEDCVLFVGSGCTGAIHKLIDGMNLRSPSNGPVVVFVGPFEHHSNLLPWREISAKVVTIKENNKGELDIADLDEKLKINSTSDKLMIGAFSAASNLTGVLTDSVRVSCLLHRYGALSLWDYASAAPYVSLDMNPVIISSDSALAYKDAMYFSMHKFIGGVDSPGILVCKKKLFSSPVPGNCAGGGTVFFVTPTSHRYLKSLEAREEGGTPSIVGAIRAGLAMKVKQSIGSDVIMRKEDEICRYVYSQWYNVRGLVVVGPAPSSVHRLPIFSLVFIHCPTGKLLHHNFICSILSDLFGIQARGGCSCAGPYAQSLLGIDSELANKYEAIIMQDRRMFQDHLRIHDFSEREVLRPGLTRLSLPYFLSQEVIDYVVKAVVMVAEHAWRLLPLYQFDPQTGLFRHPHYHPDQERVWLSQLSFDNGLPQISPRAPNDESPFSFKEYLEVAHETFISQKAESKSCDSQPFLNDEGEDLRWFLLPREAERLLNNTTTLGDHKPCPFKIKVYSEETSHPITGTASTETMKDKSDTSVKFHHPPKSIMKNVIESINDFNMISNGDRVLVCLSGGKDSLSLLHALKQYQFISQAKDVEFDIGAVTVDPGSSGYNPRPLIPYLNALGVPYYFEEQAILQQAIELPELSSICSFCSRMKRGRLYACARRQGYNVLAMGQHLDDLAESFLMTVFHNGVLGTMKANYTVKEGDLRVIRPLVYVRERDLKSFAKNVSLPVIPENCPACFAAPKERERVKQLLAAQEIMFPRLYNSLLTAMKPLMGRELDIHATATEK